MAESVDALVSNTSGATRAGSTPALGTGSGERAILLRFFLREAYATTYILSIGKSATIAQNSSRREGRPYKPSTILLKANKLTFTIAEDGRFSLRKPSFFAAFAAISCSTKQKFVQHEFIFRAAPICKRRILGHFLYQIGHFSILPSPDCAKIHTKTHYHFDSRFGLKC